MSPELLFPDPAPALPAPDRNAALRRLKAFAPCMGRRYATQRNFDFGPQDRANVSGLSPHVRHRLVTEQELVEAALAAHGFQQAEKFIQEACWRTYWKGWLEQRPSVWRDYQAGLRHDIEVLEKDGGLRERHEAAVAGCTGIACFDVWAQELVETGYLHNHARMWFASIWVYTLRLPWRLGADFFLRHLMDGDPASNTLGWRWVCGLQTVGKTYLARASNINTYTGGRFAMQDRTLASEAPPLDPGLVHPEPVPAAVSDRPDAQAATLILAHDEDGLCEQWRVDGLNVVGLAAVSSADWRSPLAAGARAKAFTYGALEDALGRAAAGFGVTGQVIDVARLAHCAQGAGARQIVTMRAHTGPLRDALDAARPALAAAGVALVELRRDWDRAFFPYADKGFFKVRKQIPALLAELGLA